MRLRPAVRHTAEDTGPSTCATARRIRDRIRFVLVGGLGCVWCGRRSRHCRGKPGADAAGDRRRPPLHSHQTIARHNDVAGFVYATMGVTYAVVLAFVVIAVWENYTATSRWRIRRPARSARSTGWPTASRTRTGRRRRRRRWPTPRSWSTWRGRRWRTGGDPAPRRSAALDHLYAVYAAPELVAAVNPEQYAESLDLLNEVSIARRERVLASDSGLPDILWLVLIGGGVVVVGFAFLFGVESRYSQAAILTGLTLTISLLLFVVADAQHPFQGSFRCRRRRWSRCCTSSAPAAAPAATPTP